jgi:hypothetical protein
MTRRDCAVSISDASKIEEIRELEGIFAGVAAS